MQTDEMQNDNKAIDKIHLALPLIPVSALRLV